ncbi:MAG: UDP-3-O-(3-hydroxymyristoyl)glucosamine N-acyltransferase [Phycisphaerae bacterium]
MMPEAPSITTAELAERLGGSLEGEPTAVIREVATLDNAGPDAVSWVGSEKLLPALATTQAGAVLVSRDCPHTEGRTVIRVNDPDIAISETLAILAPPVETVPPGVHPSATVSPDASVEGAAIGANVYVGAGAVVGAGTQLHPAVYVGSGSRIGRDCVLWPNVVVRERVTIGHRVVIHPNTTIGADGFGYLEREGKHLKIPQIGTVVIEDDVEIGANTAVDRARSGTTRIGRGTKIDNFVQISHNVDIGEDCIIVAQCGISGSTIIGHHVLMAGRAGSFDHVTIGNNVQVAGCSVVTKNVPDGEAVRGVPAIEIQRYLREQASIRKLPELMQRLRALEKRTRKLEEEAGDGPGD